MGVRPVVRENTIAENGLPPAGASWARRVFFEAVGVARELLHDLHRIASGAQKAAHASRLDRPPVDTVVPLESFFVVAVPGLPRESARLVAALKLVYGRHTELAVNFERERPVEPREHRDGYRLFCTRGCATCASFVDKGLATLQAS